MADIAQSAVLVPSGAEIDLDAFENRPCEQKGTEGAASVKKSRRPNVNVCGPAGDFANVEALLGFYPALGFQASHFGQAVELGKKMITKQPPSTIFMIQDGEFVKVEAEGASADAEPEAAVYPTLFLGITATLMGTGCRDAVRFLVQEGVAPRDSFDEHASQSTTEVNFTHLKRRFGNYAAQKLFPCSGRDAERRDKAAERRFTPVGPYKSFLSAVVMSGGGPEHDLRRACQPYHIDHYASESPTTAHAAGKTTRLAARFGNILYASHDVSASPVSSQRTPGKGKGGGVAPPPTSAAAATASHRATLLFDSVMGTLARLLCERQRELQAEAHAPASAQARQHALRDGTAFCTWSTTPSEVWALAGLWLEDLLAFALAETAAAATKQTKRNGKPKRGDKEPLVEDETAEVPRHTDRPDDGGETPADKAARARSFRTKARRLARSTAVYWAARQEVPIYCPTFADGDLARYLYTHARAGTASSSATAEQSARMLKLDLVRDIHGINKLAMYSKRTGMIVCGGGSVKHHVCNANLMRNGADYTVFISNGQEFDGSDAGARPEEAVSWGKIRCDGESVKVYSEVTVVMPLLVAQVFLPAVRARDRAAEDTPKP